MGELLRRYWLPIAGVAELDSRETKTLRVLCEDLVLYRDRAGTFGLVDRHCPHRRADMSYGFAEAQGVRRTYHGWHFDESGRCLQQPFAERAHPHARFKETVGLKASPVEAKAGLLFVYRRVREATTEADELWTTGRVCLWPNCLYTGHFEWRVPIDDENTLSVGWFLDPVPGDEPFEQGTIPCWTAPVADPQTGRWIDT